MPPKRKKTDKVVKKEEEQPQDEEMNDETKEEKPKEEPVKGEETKDESKEEEKDETKEDNGGKEDAKADDGKKDDDKKEGVDDDKKTAVKEEEQGEDKEKEETKEAIKKEDDADIKKEDDSKDESKKNKSDEESDDKDDKKRKREEDEGTPVGKRARKSHTTVAYQPDDFTEKKSTVHIPDGRGDKLKDIPSVKASIEKISINSDVFALAYRLLFARGKINKKASKAQMLDFCGYLPVQDDKMSDDAKEQEDEDIETKYSKKAYKLTVPQLKSLCDMFDVDRRPGPEEKVDKDVLIDRLLDFLGAPSEEYTNAAKKESKPDDAKKSAEKKKPAGKKKAVKKKASKKADESDEEMDDAEESEEEHKDGELPSDKQLRKWVKAYVACHNMNTATTKHALEVASSKFGVDMKPKKKTIKMFLTEEC